MRLVPLACLLATAPALWAQSWLPTSGIHAGMRGEMRTVFRGSEVVTAPVEILGVLENVGPKRSLILVQLQGGQAERTGVAAGMSGSPVYVNGQWIGALAFAFPFSKEPIGAVRPAQEMLAELTATPTNAQPTPPAVAAAGGPWGQSVLASGLARLGPGPAQDVHGMTPILTPVSLAGFTARTIEAFRPELSALGLQPMQGVGGRARSGETATPAIEPGSMISVGLIEGDLSVSAAGTVTQVDGDRLLAFGHRFLASGELRMPFAPATVLVTVPNLENSFKIVAAGERRGVIEFDHDTGIRGRIGGSADLIPLTIGISGGSTTETYHLEVVRDALITPFLVQLAAFSAIDAQLRSTGGASIAVSGTAQFSGLPDLRTREFVAAPTAPAMEASAAAVIPLAYLLQNAADAATLRGIQLDLQATPRELRWKLQRATATRTRVRAGETVRVEAVLSGNGLAPRAVAHDFRVPANASPGQLRLVFASGAGANSIEWPVWYQLAQQADPGQMVVSLNRLRPRDHLYLQASAGEPAFALPGESLQSAPGSVKTVLADQFGRDPTRVIPEAPFLEVDLGSQAGQIEGIARIDLTVVP